MRLGKGIPKLSLPSSKPSGKPSGKPDTKPTPSPRPDINGNVPGKKPGASFDNFKPGSGLDKLKPKGLGGLGDVLGGGLSAVGDVVGGVASGAAGIAGAGAQVAGMLPGAMGMMAPMMPPAMMGGAMPPAMMGPPMMPPMMGPPMMPPMMPPAMMGGGMPPGFMGPPMMPPMMPPAMMGPPMMPPMMGPSMMPPAMMGPPMMGPPMMDPAMMGVPPELQGAPVEEQQVEAEPAAKAEPKKSLVPSADDKRPEGDTRSAKEIVEDTPVLAKLGRQKDIKWNDLCKQTGVDPKLDIKDAKQNPDAVYRLAKVLEFIDSAKSADGGDRSNKVQNGTGDGNIEGLTKDGDARHGTEAGMVKDFAEQGYSFLGEHQLPTTNDTHVKADGSNKDNFQWFAGEAGKHLWFLPGVSNVLTGIGNSEGGVGGVFKGAAEGVLNTWKGAAEGVVGAFTKGRVNPASLLFGAYTGALSQTEAAPQPVKDIASFF
ncbi:hypothetical protein [Hyalangium gracile]|uniref:hypothetical protein n=1 Tax=Hyalangium gracile TaxID=394092 RepID=UPI001CCCF5C2|nr:hypothetical protein [Hyalangium gracile]